MTPPGIRKQKDKPLVRDPADNDTRPPREKQREQLLEAALLHIPFEGWGKRALLMGAADINVEAGTAKRLFPKGGDDLLAHLDVWADRRLVDQADEIALDRLRVRDRIAKLVKLRLDILAPHREALRRAVAARLLPSNAMSAGTAIWRSMDLIWTLADDDAKDGSYYTKRGLLLAVWTTTFFFWLEDHSVGLKDSEAFLERRIDNVMLVGRTRAKVESLFKNLDRFNPLKA